MCIDAPESATNSLSSGLMVIAQAGTNFPKVKRMLLYFLNFSMLLASFHAASRAPCYCHSVSSWDGSSNFGALVLRWWGSLGKSFQAMDFALECMHDVRRLLCTQHIGLVSVCLSSSAKSIRLRRLHILKDAAQLSCTFQHSHCTLVTIIFRPFARLFINLSMRIRALFQKSASILTLVEHAFWRMAFFTEWVDASSFKVILAWPSRHSTTGTSSPETSGSRCFSLIQLHERIRRRIRLCPFCTFIYIVTDTTIVSFRRLPVGFPLPTIS